MKKIILILTALLSAQAMSNDYQIRISNNSEMKVSLGIFKGILVPSICKDGFCWEEVLEKLKPISRKFKNIKGTKIASLSYEDFEEESFFLLIEDRDGYYKQIELIRCDQSTNSFSYPPIDGELIVTDDSRSDYCVEPGINSFEINY